MNITLRIMTDQEFEHWLPLSTKRQAQDRASVSGRTIEQEHTELNQIIPILLPDGKTTKHHYFYTIDTDSDKNIGFIWFGAIPGLPNGIIYLMDIYLEEPYRGKGIAKKVLVEQHRLLRNDGYESIMLSVLLTNPALHLYKQLGYEILEQTSNHAEMILSIKNIT